MLFDGVDSRQYSEEEIQESITLGEKPALFTELYDNLKLMDSYAQRKSQEVLNNLGIFDDPYYQFNPRFNSHQIYINRLPMEQTNAIDGTRSYQG